MTTYLIVLGIGIVAGFCFGNDGIRTKMFESLKKSMTSKPAKKTTRKSTKKSVN